MFTITIPSKTKKFYTYNIIIVYFVIHKRESSPSDYIIIIYGSPHLRYEHEDACLAGVDDAADGVDAGAVVLPVEEPMLHKLVVLDVPLYALPRHKVVVLLVHLPRLCWSRRVCTREDKNTTLQSVFTTVAAFY